MMNFIASKPHIPMYVSELAALTNPSSWNNKKIKVLGRLQNYDLSKDIASLTSLAEVEEDIFNIPVSKFNLERGNHHDSLNKIK